MECVRHFERPSVKSKHIDHNPVSVCDAEAEFKTTKSENRNQEKEMMTEKPE